MTKLRITPSLLISMVAMFVALGGVSYAAATIGSAEIENNSVRSKDVKNGDLRGKDLKTNTIGGTRVLESSLGQVPSAANADSATKATSADSAANAATLDGVDSAAFVQKNAARVQTAADTVVDSNYGNNANLLQLSNLAGGQYTISAKLQVDNDSAGDEVITCELLRSVGPQVLDTSAQNLGANTASAQQLNYVFIGTFTASAAGTDDVFLRCRQLGADNDADEMRIIATLVN